MATDRQLKAKTIKNDAAVVTLPTATSTVATRELSETLSLKTLAAPVLSTFGEFTEQGSAPATPSAGALRLYAKSSNSKLFTKNSAGVETEVGSGSGGAGGVNYIASTDAETGTVGWATYADAAGVIPVNGTGGSATVTWTTTTTTPLRGLSSFLFTKDAANRQGEGVSYDFTIDRADVNKVLRIAFDYTVSSGTFVAGSSSDVRVFIYDVTNSQLIYPVDFKLNSTTNDSFQASFQTNSSLSYRLIFHVATASASAYVLKIDNVQVGPQSALYGAVVTAFQSYTLTIGATTTAPTLGTTPVNNAQWRRVGGCMEVRYDFQQSTAGTAGSGNYLFPLPAGYSIDLTMVQGEAAYNATLGAAIARSGTTAGSGIVQAYDATNLAIVSDSATGPVFGTVAGPISSTYYSLSASDVEWSFSALVPIVGWGSAVQMSDAADTRVLAARASGAVASTTAGNIVIFPTSDFDTHGTYSVSTGRFTAPMSGYYRVSTVISQVNGGISQSVYVNGVALKAIAYCDAASGVGTGSLVFQASPGDLVDVRPDATTGAIDAASWVSFERLSGPSAIAANELVAAKYSSTVTQSVPDSTVTIIDFATATFDTHGSVTTGGSWKFTAPAAGKYAVNAVCSFATNATSNRELYLYKNGTLDTVLGSFQGSISAGIPLYINGSTIVSMVPGDFIDIRAYQASGGALNINPGTLAADVAVGIHRIGF